MIFSYFPLGFACILSMCSSSCQDHCQVHTLYISNPKLRFCRNI